MAIRLMAAKSRPGSGAGRTGLPAASFFKPAAKVKALRLLPEGSVAPDFELPDHTGKKWRLSDFRGKKVVLYFYPKDSTPGCTLEACGFRDYSKEIAKKGAAIVGVSCDSVLSHRQFADRHRLGFPLLSDINRDVVKRFGVWGEKAFLGYKFEGVHRVTYIIDEKGRIARVFSKVNPLGHAKQVLEAL